MKMIDCTSDFTYYKKILINFKDYILKFISDEISKNDNHSLSIYFSDIVESYTEENNEISGFLYSHIGDYHNIIERWSKNYNINYNLIMELNYKNDKIDFVRFVLKFDW